MKRLSLFIASITIAGLCAGCLEDITEAPLEIPDRDMGAPEAVTVEAGNGSVTVSWRSVGGASTYRIYRSAGEGSVTSRIGETPDTFFVDVGVRDGARYLYRVAAVGASGLEGPRSEAIAVVPGVYAILINGGAAYTGPSPVTLEFTAPATTEHMMASQSPAFAGAVWEPYAPARVFQLEGSDGALTVYARFRDTSGALSPVVSDDIVKDSYARVAGLDLEPGTRLYSPGSTVHFTMRVENDEREGRGTVSFAGFADRLELRDDGRGGDKTAGDGIYEADYRFPSALRGVDLVLTALFTDRAGNAAPSFEGGTISFTDPPEAVRLIGAVDSSRTGITIKWEASSDVHFLGYRIYRASSPGVSEKAENLVKELFNAAQTSYPDGGLREGARYYYRIFVVNDLGETAGSNEIAARTFDGYPTAPVLNEPSAVGATRATLTWSQNQDSDFGEYRLYRSTAPGVTTSSVLVASIQDREITYYDDFGLDTTANTYYYRVYAVDLGGKQSRSNEVDTAP